MSWSVRASRALLVSPKARTLRVHVRAPRQAPEMESVERCMSLLQGLLDTGGSIARDAFVHALLPRVSGLEECLPEEMLAFLPNRDRAHASASRSISPSRPASRGRVPTSR